MRNKDMSQAAIDSVERALLAAPEGVETIAIAAKVPYSRRSVQNCLWTLSKQGKASSVKTRANVTAWFHADFADRKAALAEKLLAARTARIRRENLARKAKQRNHEAQLEADFDRPSIRVIVPAHLARPIYPAGPSSVWGLAA